MTKHLEHTQKTKELIDGLKTICSNYGLGNAGSEYKIITEVFLYKFLNDKFLHEVLLIIKHKTDETVLNNQALLNNEDYFSEATKRTIIETLEERGIRNLDVVRFINHTLVTEYFYQRKAA